MPRKNTMQAPSSRMGRPKKLQRDYHTIAFHCPLDVLTRIDAEVARSQATSIARVGRSDVIRLILQQALLDETAPAVGNGQAAKDKTL